MKFRRTYKYRLFPTKAQRTLLKDTLNNCRMLYNAALQERSEAWKKQHISINYYAQANQLVEAKAAFEPLKTVNAQVLQDTLRRCDKSFQGFFRRSKRGEKSGYPRFQSKTRYNSFTYPQGGFKLVKDRLKLSKIGSVPIEMHRPLQGSQVKTLSIKRDGDFWYACFSCEIEHTPPGNLVSVETIGIDVGIEHFATLSDGSVIENPKLFRKAEANLACLARRFSKRKTRRRAKALRKAHRKVKNQRLDFHHQQSAALIKRFGTIAVEKLNIKPMVQQSHFAKSISDAGWGRFLDFLAYKAEWAGVRFVKIPAAGTSQTCPECGQVKKKTLQQRWHSCDCGCEMHRDHASAAVILALGLQSLGKIPRSPGL